MGENGENKREKNKLTLHMDGLNHFTNYFIFYINFNIY